MTPLLLAILLVIVIGVTATVLADSARRSRLASVAHLRAPRLTVLPPQRVLQVVASGDPNVIGPKAFGLLAKTYFRLPGVPRGGPGYRPMRARWPQDLATPHAQWVGRYAQPLPEGVAEIPPAESGGLRVECVTWDYGQVAEILHEGPYAEEPPTLERLRAFVAQGGYEFAGEHEEEYVAGPGPFGRGNPRQYLTILRYRVRPKA